MREFQLSKNRKLYVMILLSLTLCIVLTLVLSSYIYFVNYQRIQLKQVYQSDLSDLTKTSREIIGTTESAQALSFQIYRNATISKLMFYTKPSVYDTTATMLELSNYLNSMPFIDSIYIYNAKSSQYYVASAKGESGTFGRYELEDASIAEVLDNFQQYKPFTPIPRTVHNSRQGSFGVYSYLCFDAISSDQSLNSAVVVNISADWINHNMAGEMDPTAGVTYIMDNNGRLFSGPNLTPYPLDSAFQTYINEHVRGQETSGYHTANLKDAKHLITYTAPDTLGWQYVRITPYTLVMEKIRSIRTTTLILASIILLAGLLLSLLVSRVLYGPIRQIMRQSEQLACEKRDSLYTLKQNLLRDLVQGVGTPLARRDPGQLKQVGITFNFHAPYRLVLLQLDQASTFKQTHSQDALLYQFAVMNIASEILSPAYHVETVDLSDEGVLLLLNLKDSLLIKQMDNAQLLALLQQVQQAASEYLKLSLSGTYSPVTAQASKLPMLLREVKQAARQRFCLGHGSLIDAEEVQAACSASYVFPLEQEKRMLEALMSGKALPAKQLFTEIMMEAAQRGYPAAQTAAAHLGSTIHSALMTARRNSPLEFELDEEEHLLPQMEQYATAAEFIGAFHRFFDKIIHHLAEKRGSKQEDLVRRIERIIEEDYTNVNLSVNWIASLLGMSPVYISRIYKQHTARTIIDRIAATRLEHAKKLLITGDSSIAEIAESIGYTNSSYFYRMFKKHLGVTPTEYRRSHTLGSS
ncbi:helix-turn-helix domain-containing protein [Paenibacillus sp. CAA11]|uniref:helix-turn-helix domain-containing protein n=1 Tax=Paenibacillus sp. CAA11 TaxID=1532905 RepID=UPI00131EFD35|nr:helix-turn-helix domain-containing protein [Paenibacillus sp. CAA11]